MSEMTKQALGNALAVERPRYFSRLLMTADVMTMEQEYFRNRLRMHNLMLHGWGVVCGALVTPVVAANGNGQVAPWQVRVCPGYVLGPQGDEIIIACEQVVPLQQPGVTGSAADPCGTSRDPWCSEVWIERDPDAAYYLAVKYKEMAVRPQRIQPAGCGCDDNRCEFSRWHDGYEIGVLTEAEYQQTRSAGEKPDWTELFTAPNNANPACGPLPTQPWVVLARVELDSEGRPTVIDNCGPRRLVVSFSHFYWSCDAGVSVTSITPATVNQGGQAQQLTFSGTGFQTGLTVILGKGISVVKDSFAWVTEGSDFTITVNVASDAPPGSRQVMVINPDCTFARGELTVVGLVGPDPRPIDRETVRDRLRANLSTDAVKELDQADDFLAALDRPVVDILGVGNDSLLAKSGLKIGEFAAMSLDKAAFDKLKIPDDEKARDEVRVMHAKAAMILETVAHLKRRK